MTTIKLAAAGLATALFASATPMAAQASINPIEIDLAPEIVASVASGTQVAQATYGATTVEEFEDRLHSRSDDGTLNAQDYFELRQFRDRIGASLAVDNGTEVALATHGATTVEEFEDRLRSQSDDGTLDSQDELRIRMFEDRLGASADIVTGVEVAQWHPEAEALKERLESRSDDGTLNHQDYRRVQRLHRSLS